MGAMDYSPGQRIRLLYSSDPDPLPPGATGTVSAWHPKLMTLAVRWDAPHEARTLNVTTDADIVELIG